MIELRRHRVGVALALALAIAAGILYFFYVPSKTQLLLRQTENASLQQEIDGLTGFLRSAETANHFAAELGEVRSATLHDLYAIDSIETFIDALTADLQMMGMSNVYVVPLIDDLLAPTMVELDGVKLARLKFEIAATGEFINGGIAIEQLENQRYYVAIPSLTVEHDDGITPEVMWNFVLEAHFRTGGASGI